MAAGMAAAACCAAYAVNPDAQAGRAAGWDVEAQRPSVQIFCTLLRSDVQLESNLQAYYCLLSLMDNTQR